MSSGNLIAIASMISGAYGVLLLKKRGNHDWMWFITVLLLFEGFLAFLYQLGRWMR